MSDTQQSPMSQEQRHQAVSELIKQFSTYRGTKMPPLARAWQYIEKLDPNLGDTAPIEDRFRVVIDNLVLSANKPIWADSEAAPETIQRDVGTAIYVAVEKGDFTRLNIAIDQAQNTAAPCFQTNLTDLAQDINRYHESASYMTSSPQAQHP